MRYLGQGHEINVPVPPGRLNKARLSQLKRGFEERYERIYYRLNPSLPVQCLNWRVTVSGKKPGVPITGEPSDRVPLNEAIKGERKAYSPQRGRYVSCTVYNRYLLSPGTEIAGPAIIEETESTTVVGAGGRVVVDHNLCLIIGIGESTGV